MFRVGDGGLWVKFEYRNVECLGWEWWFAGKGQSIGILSVWVGNGDLQVKVRAEGILSDWGCKRWFVHKG